MDIVVETGAGVVGANSYNSLDEIVSFASSRGLDLPCEDDKLKPLAFRAMDYIESFSSRFRGERVLTTQSLSWPRVGAYVHCIEVLSTSLPKELKEAHIRTMVGLHAGFDPWQKFKVEPYVTEKTIGPMRIRYSKPGDFDGPAYRPSRLPDVDALMSNLLKDGGSSVRFIKP